MIIHRLKKDHQKPDHEKPVRFFKALGHSTRLEILAALLKGKKCVGDINKLIDVHQPNISQHLAILKVAGIVCSKQKGKKVCYSLTDRTLIKRLFNSLLSQRSHQC